MAGNCSEGLGDDFFEQILAVPSSYTNTTSTESAGYGRTVGDVDSMPIPMVLQLGSTSGGGGGGGLSLRGSSLGLGMEMAMPSGLDLERGFGNGSSGRRFSDDDDVNVVEGSSNISHLRLNNSNNNNNNNNNRTSSLSSSTSGITERDSSMHNMAGLFTTALGQLHSTHAHAHSVRPTMSSPPPPPPPQLHLNHHRPFHSQPPTPPVSVAAAVPHPPGIRPRVRARRGQATDPHSIAERLRRERISERMKALQELVPSVNKTDKATMLDEIVDYVKFLRLQVKVLSMSRLGGAGAVAQLVADVPLSALEQGEDIEGGANQQGWDNWSNDGTEQQVAKLIEEDVGAAMQFLQSKALCIMPISLASAIFCTPQSEAPTLIKPESNGLS